MASPQGGYPPAGYPAADHYAGQSQYNEQQPEQSGSPAGPPPPAGYPEADGGKKKKRGYAAQAYDFGAGANSALGGQPVAGGTYPTQVPVVGGAYQQPGAQPGYGAPQPYGVQAGGSPATMASPYGQPAAGGYQPPEAGYPGPAAPAQGGVMGGITGAMGHMGLGGSQPGVQVQPQQGAARPATLNQLYSTDLINQPFNVSELDLPPPPIILPTNVSCHVR